MKFFEPNEKRTTIAVYIFLVALFGVLCVILGVNIGAIFRLLGFILDVLKPILYGFVFAFVLHPLVEITENTVFAGWKKQRKALKRTLSITVVYISVIFLIVMFCVTVIPEFIINYDTFASQLSAFADNFQNSIAETINRFPGADSSYVYFDTLPDLRSHISNDVFAFTLDETVGAPIEVKPNRVLIQVQEFFSGLISALTGSFSLSEIFTSALAVINAAKNVIIGLIISIYFLASERKLTELISRTARAWLPHSAYRRIMWLTEKVNDIFRGYIMVRLADGFIVGFFTFFILFVARVPNRLLLSVVMGVSSLFPFIGPIIGITFGALVVLIIDVSYLPLYLVSTIALNILDSRYVEPLLNKDGQSTPLAAIWVFTAIIVMGGLFGAVGIVLGIPMVAFIYSVVKEITEKYLKRRRLPVDTSAYFVGQTKYVPDSSDGENSDDSSVYPNMETYFAEKREDELEASRNIQKNVSKNVSKLKSFFKRKKK